MLTPEDEQQMRSELPQPQLSPAPQQNKLAPFLAAFGASLQGRNVGPDLEKMTEAENAKTDKVALANTMRQMLPSLLPDFPIEKYQTASDDQWIAAGKLFPNIIKLKNDMTDTLSKERSVKVAERGAGVEEQNAATNARKEKNTYEIEKEKNAIEWAKLDKNAKNDREQRLRDNRVLTDIDQFNNKFANAEKEQLDNASVIQTSLAQKDNAAAFGNAKMFIAKLANGGRPTDKDVEVISPNPDVASAAKRIYDMKIQGTPLPEDVAALTTFMNALSSNATKRYNMKAKSYATARAKFLNLTPDEYYQTIHDQAYGVTGQAAPAGQQPPSPTQAAPSPLAHISDAQLEARRQELLQKTQGR